jgi:uncharacterized protein YbcI
VLGAKRGEQESIMSHEDRMDGNGALATPAITAGPAMARALVRVHAELFGRGPEKVRAVWKGDVVTIIAERLFTRSELTLIEAGKFSYVREGRQAVQEQIEPVLRQAAEEATGRRVMAFLTQVAENDVACAVLVLENGNGTLPEPGP